jgi:hypothetical protein
MSQSKKHSFIEACINTAIGFTITMLCSYFIYPLCGMKITTKQNLALTLCFTVISIIRSYLIRRLFTRKIDIKDGRQ